MPDKNRSLQNVVAAVERATTSNTTVEVSTGVVFRVKKVASRVLADVVRKFERPKIPVVHIEDKGRDEENPNDPSYIAQLSDYETEVAIAISDAMLLLGTEIVSIPVDLPGPESDVWTEDADALGLVISDNPKKRYLTWVSYIAAPEQQDTLNLMEAIGRLSGVSEADVNDAKQRFRRKS